MQLLKLFVQFWCSLRLTVTCLIGAMVLVFVGTLAQVDQGLYDAQKKYFRSYFLVPESIGGAGWAQIRVGSSQWMPPEHWNEIEGSQFSLIDFESVHDGQRGGYLGHQVGQERGRGTGQCQPLAQTDRPRGNRASATRQNKTAVRSGRQTLGRSSR